MKKLNFKILIIVFLLVFVFFKFGTNIVYFTISSIADNFINKGNYQNAENLYKKTIYLQDKVFIFNNKELKAKFLKNLAETELYLNNYDLAEIYLKQSISKSKYIENKSNLYVDLFEYYLRTGKYDKAQEIILYLINLKVDIPRYSPGEFYSKISFILGDVKSLKKYSKINNSKNFLLEAYINELEGNLLEAENNYKKSISINLIKSRPFKSIKSFNNLRLFYKKYNKQKENINLLKTFLFEYFNAKNNLNKNSNENNDYKIKFDKYLIEFYIDTKDYTNAEKLCIKIIKYFENNKSKYFTTNISDAYELLGTVYEKQNKYDKAEIYYNKSLYLRGKINSNFVLCSYNKLNNINNDKYNYKKDDVLNKISFLNKKNYMYYCSLNIKENNNEWKKVYLY